MNLSINAKDNMCNYGKLNISLKADNINKHICRSCHERFSGEYVVINISDNGHGIAEDVLQRMFEPFFTTKSIGEGTGMGLSVVHGVVHKLGGHIVVTSHVGEGTSFEILLPISHDDAENTNLNKIDSKQYDFSDLSILVVDDESSVAGFLQDLLKKYHARVKVFTDSEHAVEYYKAHSDEFDIVITDQTMPNLTGAALSQSILALRPEAKIILCTGFSSDIDEESANDMVIKAFMYKPISSEKLYNIINKLR